MKLINHYNEDLEKILTAVFGLVGIAAIFINLDIKGYGNENWLDAIKDIAGLIVVLVVFLAAIRISQKSETHYEMARNALQRLQAKHPQILMGPRYNRDGYDPEKGKGLEYLFVTNDNRKSTLRAKLISIQPLEEGCLYIYIQTATLADALNYGRGNVTDEDLTEVKVAVKAAVMSILSSQYDGKFELLAEVKDSIIAIDFDETNMRKKQYARAISECAEAATLKLLEFRKPMVK